MNRLISGTCCATALRPVLRAVPVALVIAGWCLGLTARPSRAASQVAYMEIEGTRSPSQRYALAWALPGKVVDLKRLVETDYQSSLDLDKVVNYLVDRRRHVILATLHPSFGGSYWAAGGSGPEKHKASFQAAWAPDERTAVVVYGGPWNYTDIIGLRVIRSRRGVVARQTSFAKSVESNTRRYLARTQPAIYRHDKTFMAIIAGHPTFLSNNTFALDVSVGVPKGDGIKFDGEMRLKLLRVSGGLRPRLISLRPAKFPTDRQTPYDATG